MSISYQIEEKKMPEGYYIPAAFRVRISNGDDSYLLKNDEGRATTFGSYSAAENIAKLHIFNLTQHDPITDEVGWAVCEKETGAC